MKKNKLNIFIFLLFFLLQSCSAAIRYTHKKKGIDPIFQKYVNSYRKIIGNEYSYKFNNTSINFSELEDNVIGRCWWLLDGGFEIEIDRSYWNSQFVDSRSKEFLLYHELEHCIRYRMHTNKKKYIKNISDIFEEIGYYMGLIPKSGFLEDGCPTSLMHSHAMSYYCRNKHYKYYIEELKKW